MIAWSPDEIDLDTSVAGTSSTSAWPHVFQIDPIEVAPPPDDSDELELAIEHAQECRQAFRRPPKRTRPPKVLLRVPLRCGSRSRGG